MRLLDLLWLLPAAQAIRLPFEVQYLPAKSSAIEKRTPTNIMNMANSVYVSNITLGSTTIPVMLDTGSSDLWVTGAVPGAQDSRKAVTLDYAVGKASGDIFYSNLSLSDYTVSNQAFLLVANTSSFSTDISASGYKGLIGLGPNSGSAIREKLDRDDNLGDAVLDRIFQQNKTGQNYISFTLSRNGDPGSNVTGEFTIGELVKGFESVTNQPKLDIVTVPGLTDRDQHWQMYTDVDGVIGPDGQPIKTESIVNKAPKGQLVTVIDSGFTLPQVPRAMADAIYGRVQGAEWNVANQVWTIPCGQLLNISFKFGGVNFPIHPLDTSSSDFGIKDSNGNPICVGTFQPITSAFSLLGEYDIILGMAFLRNAYTLIDLGNFVEGSGKDQGDGFVQMLPLTDADAAQKDFVSVRLGGKDTTGDSQFALLPASEGQKSPESEKEKKQHLAEKVLSHWPEIFVGSFLVFCGIVGLIIWKCCCRRRCAERKKQRALAKAGAVNGGGLGKRLSVSMNGLQMNTLRAGSTYQPLGDHMPPSMSGHMSTHSSMFGGNTSAHSSMYDISQSQPYYNGHRV